MLIGLSSTVESLIDPVETLLGQIEGIAVYPTLTAFYEDDISDVLISVVTRVWESEAENIRYEGGIIVHLCHAPRDLLSSLLPITVKVNDYVIATQPIESLHQRLAGLLHTIKEDLHGNHDRPAA